MIMTTETIAPVVNEVESTLDEAVSVALIFRDPAYRRPLNQPAVNKLLANWARSALGVVYLSLRADGRYASLDGWHRISACKEIEGPTATIPAKVHIDLTLQQEAWLWTRYNRDRRQPTPLEVYQNRLIELDPIALEMRRISHEAGLEISNAKTAIRCVTSVEKVMSAHGGVMLTEVLHMLADAFGRDTGIGSPAVLGLAAFLLRYQATADLARVRRRLDFTGQFGMEAGARRLQGAHKGMSAQAAWGMSLLELYNNGLRSNRLGEWTAKVVSEAGREAHRRRRHRLGCECAACDTQRRRNGSKGAL